MPPGQDEIVNNVNTSVIGESASLSRWIPINYSKADLVAGPTLPVLSALLLLLARTAQRPSTAYPSPTCIKVLLTGN